MKDSKKIARIMAILLTVALLMTFIVPAFAMLVGAEGGENITGTNDGSATPAATPTATPTPTHVPVINAEGEAFIISFSVDGQLEKGQSKDVKITVSDQRLNFSGEGNSSNIGIAVNAATGSFTAGAPAVSIDSTAADGLVYTVTFPNFTYNGGDRTFSFDVAYTYNGGAVTVPLKIFTHTVSQAIEPTPAPTATPTPTPSPTPSPTPTPTPAPQDVAVDVSKDVFIQSYKVSDKSTGKELTAVNPGQTVKLRFNVIDNRVAYLSNAPIIRARMSQGSFKNNNHGDVKYEIMNVGTTNGRKILAYQVTFDNVVYQGGSQQTSFDVSYTNYNTGAPITVPYTELTQNITQAVDDIPEPKIILNSTNYGGVAYINKPFTLSTSATNSSSYLDL